MENYNKHLTIWDGTSAFVGTIEDVEDDMVIEGTFYSIEHAQDLADILNKEA